MFERRLGGAGGGGTETAETRLGGAGNGGAENQIKKCLKNIFQYI